MRSPAEHDEGERQEDEQAEPGLEQHPDAAPRYPLGQRIRDTRPHHDPGRRHEHGEPAGKKARHAGDRADDDPAGGECGELEGDRPPRSPRIEQDAGRPGERHDGAHCDEHRVGHPP
jgi:hypothetical protein